MVDSYIDLGGTRPVVVLEGAVRLFWAQSGGGIFVSICSPPKS